MSRIVCVGETFVDLLGEPELADIGASEFFQRAAGGAVSNVAIGIARLGGDVAFVGAVGRDPFGKFLVRTLAHENVGVDGVRSVDTATSLIFVARGRDGARDFYPVSCPGADVRLSPDDLDGVALRKARCVHFGGVTLAAEPGRSACLAAAAIGREHGLVTFDPNPRPAIFASVAQMRAVLVEACEAAHLVKCSEEDLDALGIAGHDPATLLTGGVRAAVVTLGSNGCRWATVGGATGEVRAPRVDAVDTTGAGDAFMAALVWRLCEHHKSDIGSESIAEAAVWATAAGALACTRIGAIDGLPRADEVEAMTGASHG
ncbi:MAG TPA: carbohydrate kinase [Candidatus Eremiobacteraceae bacterium]|nr:carbohydrate kinase [Candidatus Eremiobacteraceae bacterium]